MYFYGYRQHQPHAFVNKLNYTCIIYKTKISLSKSMLRSNNGTYWKSARVLRKNNFNRTNVVDDVVVIYRLLIYSKISTNTYLIVCSAPKKSQN